MKIAAAAVAAALLFVASALGQAVTVGYDQTTTLQSPGATAAYALNASVAEAVAIDGVVRIRGVGTGKTTVVIVSGDSTASIVVNVVAPPSIYPAGILIDADHGSGESGIWESRFSSEPRQVSNLIDLRRQSGANLEQLRAIVATFFSSEFANRVGLPLFSYELGSASRDLVIGDSTLANSPLTVSGTQIRGVHVREGPWSIHGGFASLASYQGTFFAAEPEYVAGATRVFTLSPSTRISANLYYFANPATNRSLTENGPVASFVYSRRDGDRSSIDTELAAGRHGVGASLQGLYDDSRRHVTADIRYRPHTLPALALDAQRGTFANLSYANAVSRRLNIAATILGSDYDIPQLKQRTFIATERTVYALSERVSLTGGTIFSSFEARDPSPLTVRTLSFPVGAAMAWRRFDLGGEVQPTFDLGGRRADAYNAHAGGSLGALHVSGYYRRDVDLPTLATFFSQVPGLQDALERAGIFVSDVSQIIQYLRDTAFLVALGFAGDITFNVAPVRTDASLNVDYVRAAERLTFSMIRSNTQLITGDLQMESVTATYARRLGHGDEVSGAASIVRLRNGAATSNSPAIALAYRHRLAHVPPLSFRFRGRISGHVFRDDALTGRYTATNVGIAGATVSLDDESRSTKTNSAGYYEFDDVEGRVHRVSVSLPIATPFSLTTDSPRAVDVNESADFGVTFLLGRVFGRLANDASQGVAGVTVRIEGAKLSRTTNTGDTGDYAFDNLPDGPYWITTVADSYPIGYDVAQVPEDPIVVRGSSPVRFDMFAHVLRSISGVVTTLDPRTGLTAPLDGAEVTIPQLSRTARTNASGRYRFNELPAGSITVELTAAGRKYSQLVIVPAGPYSFSALNFTVISLR